MTTPTSGAHKFVTLDATRGIAAICVMLFHYTSHSSGAHRFINAKIAVDYFLCLSGFVIAYSYEQRLQTGMGVDEFFARRLIRLYPMYVLGTLLGLMTIIASEFVDKQGSWRSLLPVVASSLLFLPYMRHYSGSHLWTNEAVFPLNLPAWSLFFELAVNLLYAAARFTSAGLLIALPIAFLFVAETTETLGSPGGPDISDMIGGFPRAFFSFFVGILIFKLWQKLPPQNVPALIPCIVTTGMCVLPYDTVSYLVCVFLVSPITVWLATANPINRGLHRLFLVLGEISYPLYAIHWPLFMLARLICNLTTHNPIDTPLPDAVVPSLAIFATLISFVLSRRFDLPARAFMFGLWTTGWKDEARRIGAAIAKLPELLRKP